MYKSKSPRSSRKPVATLTLSPSHRQKTPPKPISEGKEKSPSKIKLVLESKHSPIVTIRKPEIRDIQTTMENIISLKTSIIDSVDYETPKFCSDSHGIKNKS